MTTESDESASVIPAEDQSQEPPLEREVWDQTPEPERQMLLSRRLEVIQSPLLPPNVLKEYDTVVPGLAEKLISWTEQESQHRRNIEIQAFEDDKKTMFRGQLFGLVTSIFGLAISGAVGIFAAVYGSFAAMSVAIVVAIVAVGGPFAARILANKWLSEQSAEERRD